MTQYEKLMSFLGDLDGEDGCEGLMKFHADHEALIRDAKGSKSKHQAWPGGYLDHLVECLTIGDEMWNGLGCIRELPFEWSSVVKVLYFHDVEKMFKYSNLKPPRADVYESVMNDKMLFYKDDIGDFYWIDFTDEELNALEHIHGEKDYGEHRIAGPLAAFCHCCDMLSARMWHDKPTKEEKELYDREERLFGDLGVDNLPGEVHDSVSPPEPDGQL
jgi:hypothetical protein